ncbi:MAG: hypothetical protein CL878_15335 [Dehalococcoidia bacterium]|nr:hypothetical protein [Dehalococcoidia bacterium]
MADRPKNVLLLWTDQQRADTVGPGKDPKLEMPNLDQLVATGAHFQHAYCAQPVCSPARATVLTGVYPHTHGVVDNNIVPDPDIPMITELLQPVGYATGYNGKWHLGNEHRAQRGFNDWVSTEGYVRSHEKEGYSSHHQFLVSRGQTPPDRNSSGEMTFSRFTAAGLPEEVGKPAFQTQEAIRFLETHRDEPFFLSVNFLEPHSPFDGPLNGYYRPEDMTLPDTWYTEMEESVPLRFRRLRDAYAGDYMTSHSHWVKSNDKWGWKDLKARYWGLCTLVDRYFGRILTRLEELGLAEDTIVVHTSDHGHMMGEHRLLNKSVQYDQSAQIPFVIRVPGLAPQQLATPVGHVDLVPTLLDLLDQPLPDHLQGNSLVPLLQNGDSAPDEGQTVIEWNGGLRDDALGNGGPAEVRTVRRGFWKLSIHASGEHELYDLQEDPAEQHNAFADPGNETVIRDLYERLRQWQRETDDSLELPALE